MFKNYLKTAFRNLQRNKSYALINILGLSVGIAACMLIFLVIKFETSFDNFHQKKDSIYRIGSEFKSEEGNSFSPGSAFPMAAALKLDFPEIKQVARIYKSGDDQVTVEDGSVQPKKFQTDVFFAEPEFFKIFDFPWLAGIPATALTAPNTVAISKTTAEKYFGDWHNAIGKTLKRNNQADEVYRVTGIIEDIPANSDFPIEVVASYATLQNTGIKRSLEDWVSTFGGAYTFVVLPSSLPVEKFNGQLHDFAKKHKPEAYSKDAFIAQPLSEIHYDERFGNFRSHTFSKSLILALELIGIFLILVACVNFINLATAQAVNRAKEVGVRKVLGGNRKQLALQFLSETGTISLAALIVATILAALTLPFLNDLLEIKMKLDLLSNVPLLIFAGITFLLVTLLSGFYPAIVLSGFNPITALKSKFSASTIGGVSLRRALVILQFSIAHVLIIGMLIVVGQMNYFRNASLGFDKASIVNVAIPGDSISRTRIDQVRQQLLQNPGIESLSFSYASPSADGNWNSDFKFDNSEKNSDFSANLKWADADYFKTYNLQFVAGQSYAQSDTVKEFVVNETFVKKLGITDPKDILGKQVNFWDGQVKAPVVGVIKDFNSYSLRDPMAPVVLSTLKEVYQTINVKIKPGMAKSTLTFIEDTWNKTYPDYVYQFAFLDDTIDAFYKQENQLSQLYKIFAGIAIFISCLGLYGLVSFMAQRRTKELGIRKVLGASVKNIIYLLSKEFSLLIIIAFIIAAPIAWYLMKGWLENYTYRIDITVGIFALSILCSMIIAWITVGHRAFKAATTNPVKTLRTE